MLNTKSFCHVDTLVSNEAGVSNTVGEVTPHILSFSRELGKYANSAYPNLTLYTLYSKTGIGANAVTESIPGQTVTNILSMCNFIIAKMFSTSGELYQDILQAELQSHASTVGFTAVEVGSVYQHGTRWAPDFIRFKLATDATEEHTIWFSSTAMASQYTEYEIVVVSPLVPVDNFFNPPSNVQAALNALTPAVIFDRVNAAANNNPPTMVVSQRFEYHNPQNAGQLFNTDWTCLIYGPAGNNIDSIKDALVDFILSNSTRTRNQWMAILPDIFKRTEFIIAPLWDKYAMEPLTLYPQGIRSPLVNINDLLRYTEVGAPEYSGVHIGEYVMATSFNYTSIAVGVIGNIENRDGKYSISDYYPDYFVVSSSSIDFNRMEQRTQDWVNEINNMLAHAETMTAVSSVPPGYSRVTRNDMVYIAKTIENVAYLVATKSSMLSNNYTSP